MLRCTFGVEQPLWRLLALRQSDFRVRNASAPSIARLTVPMRAIFVVCLLSFALPDGSAALAQSKQQGGSPTAPSAPGQKPAEEVEKINARVADWLKTCLADWDKATHMTKSDWEATCRRVSAERGRFLLESQDYPSKEDLKARQR
jgi:hypothetical protein